MNKYVASALKGGGILIAENIILIGSIVGYINITPNRSDDFALNSLLFALLEDKLFILFIAGAIFLGGALFGILTGMLLLYMKKNTPNLKLNFYSIFIPLSILAFIGTWWFIDKF